MALGMIVGAFREASYMFTATNGHPHKALLEQSHVAYAFIRGTGLEIALQAYGMAYNADSLREEFHRMFHIE